MSDATKNMGVVKKSIGTKTDRFLPAIPGKTKILDDAGKNMWFADSFRLRIASGQEHLADLPETSWSSFEMEELMSDREIVSELPTSYIFGKNEFCGYMACLIEMQGNGEGEGVLLAGTDRLEADTHNVFYVEDINGAVCAVVVIWAPVCQMWCFHAVELNKQPWKAGARVFSAN